MRNGLRRCGPGASATLTRARGAILVLGSLMILLAVLAAPAPAHAAAGHGQATADIGAPAPAAARPMSVSEALGCARPAKRAGFTRHDAVTAVAVGMAESACNAGATGYNGPTAGCPSGSVDRGMWQINSCYHPEVSNSCAYDANCSAAAAYTISSAGTDWQPWSTYDYGQYLNYLGVARQAVHQVYGGRHGGH
jgi:hypothetical protein